MIILSDQILKNPKELGMLPGVKLIIEVKQDVKPQAIPQTVSELIALDIIAAAPVMALLTDLREYWQFFWVADPSNDQGIIESATICDPSEAFAVIRALCDHSPSPEIGLPCFKEPIKRKKIFGILSSIGEGTGTGNRESLEQYFDVASILGPDWDMARAVARRVTESIPTLTYFS